MTTLRLYLTEHWPDDPACDWALIGADGRPSAEGHSEPRYWPAADQCEFVLAGSQSLWLAARLPRAPRREQDRLIRFALEEQLVQEPDSQHFTLTDREDESARVLIVARERLQQIMAQLTALGRLPVRAYSELQTIPTPPDGWQFVLSARHGILSGSAGTPFALDLDGAAPPPGLSMAVAHARQNNRLPARIVLRGAHDAPKPDAAAWSEALGAPCEVGEEYRWSAFSSAANLLHAEFSPAQNKGRIARRVRPALWLMGSILAIEALFSLGQIFWQRYQITQARSAMERVFRSAFPNQPVVNPVQQFHSQLGLIRRAHGQLSDDDLLSLLATVGEALGGDARESMDNFRFEEGRLELTLSPRAAANMPAIIERLNTRGLQAAKRGENKLALRRDPAQ